MLRKPDVSEGGLLPLVRAAAAETQERLERLARRLADFYASEAKYFDIAAGSDQSRFYEILEPHLRQVLAGGQARRLRVLEVGAGRTGFPAWLERVGLRQSVEFTAQDVTAINQDWLKGCCDGVVVCDATGGIPGGPYDVIFSTFVYEHVVFPQRFLESSLSALNTGGLLAIFSPLYTAPGYVPPALRALPRWRGLLGSGYLFLQNWLTALSRRPNFWVVVEPALFSRPFFIDADAVHMVSSADLKVALGGRVERLPVRLATRGFWDWVWCRFLLLAAVYLKK